MEYVQTVLVQIEATKFDEAARPGGLLDQLDEHRAYLDQHPGFKDMSVSRSINPQGNVLLVVETHWADDHNLIAYETREPTVMSIINKYADLIVKDSLQVLDMEAVRAGARHLTPSEQATERLALPILIPMAALAFALLIIYGLSRVYLEIDPDAATALAAGITIFVLIFAAYFATRPSIEAWQVGGVFVLAAALLIGGATWALIEEDEGAAEGDHAGDETPPPDGGDGGPAGDLVGMGDNFFEYQGEQTPTIQVTAGEEVTLDLENIGQAIHNMRIAGVDDSYETDDDFVSEPNLFRGGDEGTITFQFAEAGTYDFRCDFHPVQMVGTIEVQ